MSQGLPEESLIADSRVNAVISWGLVVVLASVAVVSLVSVLLVDLVIALVAAFVALAPAVVSRDWTRTVPWPLLALASIPVFLRAAMPTLLGGLVVGFSVAALTMLVVVALELTTSVRMTPNFAVFFTVLATMATAGFWALGSAASAQYLGTPFVQTNEQLMRIFSVATVAGLVAGGVFRWYFRRKLRVNRDVVVADESRQASEPEGDSKESEVPP